jgi:hypothetical protein
LLVKEPLQFFVNRETDLTETSNTLAKILNEGFHPAPLINTRPKTSFGKKFAELMILATALCLSVCSSFGTSTQA